MSQTRSGYFEVEVIETISHRFQVKADTSEDAANEVRRLTTLAAIPNSVPFGEVVYERANPRAQVVKREELGYTLNRATPRYVKSE